MALALEKIKGKIAENGFSQKDVASLIGISRESFSFKINGKRNFSLEELEKLSVLLSMDMSSFFLQSNVKNKHRNNDNV